MLFIFSMPVLIRHLWQLKTVGFLHWCLIHALLQPWHLDEKDGPKTTNFIFILFQIIYTAIYTLTVIDIQALGDEPLNKVWSIFL
jgi:hypothetical protein